VIFQPLAQGTFSGTLQLTTTDLNNPTFALNMGGTGLAPVGLPAMGVSPATLSFPSVYVGGSSSLQAVTITNNSPYAMNLQFMKSGNGDEFVLDGTYCSSLQPGKSCRISVQFVPTAEGTRTAILKMVDLYSGFASSVSVSGNALPVSGGPLVFVPNSVTLAGGGIPQEVTVINGGTSDLTIEKMTGIASSDCGTVIPENGTCHITVQADSQQGAVQNLTASILASSSATPYTLPITVQASFDGTALFTSPLFFGTVPLGGSVQRTFSLVASKFLPGIYTQVMGPNAAEFISPGNPGCSFSFDCDATVTFTPQGSGLRTATLETRWGNIAVYGVGGDGDGADFTITQSNFPNTIVPGYAGTLKVTNTETAPLALTSNAGVQQYPFSSSNDECSGKRLEIGASCTVDIYYGGGTGSGTVVFTDAISGISRSLELNGETAPPLNNPTATPTQLGFGDIAVGDTSAVQNVSVTQADGHPMLVSLDTPGDFLIDSAACAQGTPCQIGVRFQPLSAEAKGSWLQIRDRITGASTRVSLGGTGGLPQISVPTSPIVFPTQEIGSTWSPESLIITNAGDAPLNVSGISLSGGDAADFSLDRVSCYQIPAGGTCQVNVSFVPYALGEKSTTLQITSDSQTDKVINIPVSATSTQVP
jgi:hypothetical protein